MPLLKTFFIFTTLVYADNSLTVAAVSAPINTSVITCDITYAHTDDISALQFSITSTATITSVSATVGAESVAAEKEIICNIVNSTCIIYGMNHLLIGDGVVASITVTFASPLAAAQTISFATALGSTHDGNEATVTGNSGAVSVFGSPELPPVPLRTMGITVKGVSVK